MPLIVFDLDGTLIDSRRDLADSVNEVLERSGARALPADEVMSMVGEGAPVLVERALRRAGLDVPIDEALRRFRSVYARRLLDHTRPYDGIVAVVARAAARATLAVLTNKPGEPTERLLAAFDLLRHFRRVVGGDSSLPRKPDPTALRQLIEQAGVTTDDTLFVGDSMIDVETARRAGVAVCVALYGFGRLRGDLLLRGDELRAGDVAGLGSVIEAWLDDTIGDHR